MSYQNQQPWGGAPGQPPGHSWPSRPGSAPGLPPTAAPKRSGRTGRNSRTKIILTALLFGVIGILVVAGGTRVLTYTVGLSGTPGHLKVAGCGPVGKGRGQHTDCYGTYRSDDGRITDQNAVVVHESHLGPDVTVDRTGDDVYYLIGFGAASGPLAAVCIGLTLLSFSGILFVQSSRHYPPRDAGQRLRPVELPPALRTWLRVCALTTLGSLGLFVVFFVIALASGI
jgi:hypothetical protein